MKNYTTFMLLIGILFSHCSRSLAGDGDIPGPGDTVPFIIKFIQAGIIQAFFQIIQKETISIYEQSKKNGESLWEYYFTQTPKLKVTTYEQLQLRPELNTNTFNSLPHSIQTILTNEKFSNTGEHRPIILYGESGTGKTTLAQQIALHTGGNYYHIHQRTIDGHSDATIARFLCTYVNEISKQTADGATSTLHLEEFGKQLGHSTQNDMHNIEHGPFENTWKKLLEEFELNYPKVRVIACSNFGKDHKTEQFNSAIKNHRAHIIKIDTPNNMARQSYFTTTCVAHLELKGIKNANIITGSITNQRERNQKLTDEYLVSDTMHQNAAAKHESTIASTTTPLTLNALLWPPAWVEIYNKNKTATQMKNRGYTTPVVDWNLTTATATQAQKYADLTNGSHYRELDAITESARRDKVQQSARMKERLDNQKSAYTIDKNARTYSVKVNPGDPDNNEIVTAVFGQVQPQNLLRAAAYAKIETLNKSKEEHPASTQRINNELAKIDTHDIQGLAKKLMTKEKNDIIHALKKYKTAQINDTIDKALQ